MIIVYSEPLIEVYNDGRPEGVAGDAVNIALGAERLNTLIAQACNSKEIVGVGILAAVGADARGDKVLRFLQANNINTEFLTQLREHPTAAYQFQIDSTGFEKFRFKYIDRNNAAMRYLFSDCPSTLRGLTDSFDHGDFFVITGIGASRARNERALETLLSLVGRARASGAAIIIDAEVRPRLWDYKIEYVREFYTKLFKLAHVVFFTWPDDIGSTDFPVFAWQSPEEIKHKLFYYGVDFIVLKLGPGGVICWIREGPTYRIPAPAVDKVLDTAGAGSTLLAGTVISLAHGIPMQRALRIGSVAAGAKLRHAGAVLREEYLPAIDSILRELESNHQTRDFICL